MLLAGRGSPQSVIGGVDIDTLTLTTPLDEEEGGTGYDSYTTGDLLYASATTTLSKLGIGTSGRVLQSGGSVPSWVALSALGLDHGTDLAGLTDDDHTQYLYLAGRAGGQSAIGGTAAGDKLNLKGSTDSELGTINIQSPVIFESVEAADTGSGISAITFNSSFTASGFVHLDSDIMSDHTITIDASAFIFNGFWASGTYTQSVAPNAAFSDFVMFNDTAKFTSDDASIPSLRHTGFRIAPKLSNSGLGAWAAQEYIRGMNFTPDLEALVSGDSTSVTSTTGAAIEPQWNVVAGATVSFGTIRGVWCKNPSVTFAGDSAGTKAYIGYTGLQYDNQTAITPSGFNVVVNSALVAGAKNIFLFNAGGAQSRDNGIYSWINGGYPRVVSNSAGLVLGTSSDVQIGWDGTGLALTPASGTALRWNFAAGTNYSSLSSVSATKGLQVSFSRISLGSTAPNPSATTNVYLDIVPPSRTAITPAVTWKDFRVESASTGIAIVNNMTNVDVAYFNGTAITGAFTVDDLSTIRINQTNNTSYGTRKQGLFVENCRARFDGYLNFSPSSPSQITADTNDYAIPTLTSARHVLRLSTDASRTLTGLALTQDGDALWIVNIGSNDLILAHENASSSAANRIISSTGADLTLNANEAAFLWYDTTTARWRILATTGA